MEINLSDKSTEQPGYAPQEVENSLKTWSEVRFNWYVECVKRGILAEDSYNHAKKLAEKYEFSTKDLEDSLPDGLRKQFDKHLELIKSGRHGYEKIAETARNEAKKYGYIEQAVTNAEAVGKQIQTEIQQSREKTQKPDGLEIRIRKTK
ncbi:hypothetical protein HYT26_04555 [Candidatus Pacearchaeota archaeon]|nr:hypothetical protein [Candidatus Pacearchaeota archaeon]